jgi:very-short-patch-repair endonuclease
VSGSNFFDAILAASPKVPSKVSSRTMQRAIEEALIHTYTRQDLETVFAEELGLQWPKSDQLPNDIDYSKRDVIKAYTAGWDLPPLVALARRIVAELEVSGLLLDNLTALLNEYDRGGGVGTPAKNLIFAANGPKPELVLRDAVNNDIEIVRNGEFCLIYDQSIPADGLTFSNLIDWWRARQGFAEKVAARDVGMDLHNRLRSSVSDNPVELLVFDTYARRYRQGQFDIPALIPQVYLHYDPSTQLARRAATQGRRPLVRQRMDFLILFSSRHRVVLEVDGKQHYANGDTASPALYSEMVAEDRRLRLAGYEVYRFGGAELMRSGADKMVADFFDELAERMR